MQTQLTHRLVKRSGPRKGQTWATLFAEKYGDAVYVAVSLVHPPSQDGTIKGDKFNKIIEYEITVGRITAALEDRLRRIPIVNQDDLHRATGASPQFIYYHSVNRPLRRFLERCRKFFKDTPIFLAAPRKLTVPFLETFGKK
jgi:hypothetical protein